MSFFAMERSISWTMSRSISQKRVQELIPIYRIGIDGVFQLEDLPDGVEKLYDKAYLFEDANFAAMDFFIRKATTKSHSRMI